MKPAPELARRYLERFPQRPGRWHIMVLRLIFLSAMIAGGVLAGFIRALLVFGFTGGTNSNGVPALVTFCAVLVAFTCYGLYVSFVAMSNGNLRLPEK